LALAVASGEPALGSLAVKRPGKVLYLSLEDGERRLRSRVRKLTNSDMTLENVDLVFSLANPLNEPPGIEALRNTLSEGRYELMVVDTLVAGIPDEHQARDIFRADYRRIGELRELATDHDLALLIVAHTRKQEAEYSLSSVAGTGGLTAAADAILMLSKTSGAFGLELVSRDTEERQFALQRDSVTSGWTIGPSVAVANPNHEKILKLILDNGPLTSAKIQELMQPENDSTVRSWIMRMRENGLLIKDGEKYRLPCDADQVPDGEEDAA
jgi:RecA-family ATPase